MQLISICTKNRKHVMISKVKINYANTINNNNKKVQQTFGNRYYLVAPKGPSPQWLIDSGLNPNNSFARNLGDFIQRAILDKPEIRNLLNAKDKRKLLKRIAFKHLENATINLNQGYEGIAIFTKKDAKRLTNSIIKEANKYPGVIMGASNTEKNIIVKFGNETKDINVATFIKKYLFKDLGIRTDKEMVLVRNSGFKEHISV